MINTTNKKESEYYTEKDFISSTRVLTLMSALLFFVFSIVDIWAIPSALTEALVVRGGAITILLFAFFMTYTRYFYPFKNIIMSVLVMFSAVAIEYMIYKALPSDQAYSVYFVGVVLILITLHSLTYINALVALIMSVLIILNYIGIEMFLRPAGFALTHAELLTNLFFICSALVIGMVARSMRDKYMRDNYHLQMSLTTALKEKTLEAHDYAHKANHDALTGLPNRRYMTVLLEESLQAAKEKDKILAFLFFDLNGFKAINDNYGHAIGDEVLTIVAKRLELAIRKGDHVSRLGGDEFLIGVMLDKEGVSNVDSLATKYINIISKPMHVGGHLLEVGTSIGCSAYPMHGNNIDVLIDIADKKMYRAKKAPNSKAVGVEIVASEESSDAFEADFEAA